MNKCLFEAHRGVGTEYPENTMPAFKAAAEQGYSMIELDTKFTADGRCVILHDRTINRMARNPDGSVIKDEIDVSSLTFAELERYDFGIAKGERFRGTRIAQLGEVLDFAAENKIPLKFDNVLHTHTADQLETFFGEIKRRGALEYAHVTSGTVEFARCLAKMLPGAYIHYDGVSDEESLMALRSFIDKDRLTSWVRYPNEYTTFSKTPPADAEYCATVKKYTSLGIWLLRTKAELERAEDEFMADIIETDGSLKPNGN